MDFSGYVVLLATIRWPQVANREFSCKRRTRASTAHTHTHFFVTHFGKKTLLKDGWCDEAVSGGLYDGLGGFQQLSTGGFLTCQVHV